MLLRVLERLRLPNDHAFSGGAQAPSAATRAVPAGTPSPAVAPLDELLEIAERNVVGGCGVRWQRADLSELNRVGELLLAEAMVEGSQHGVV